MKNIHILDEERIMKQPNLATPQERKAFHQGYTYGYREGMQKVSMLIQLILNSTEDFEQSILQNSKEAVELRKLMTGSEEEI